MNNNIMQALIEKKDQLQLRIDAIEADFKKGRSQDFAEQTSENENNEVLSEIHHEAKIELGLIKQAIARFNNNEYGLCQQCAEPISSKRLKVLPYTNTCIDCAK